MHPPLRPSPRWLSALQDDVLAVERQGNDLQPAIRAIASALDQAGIEPVRVSVSILTQHPALAGLGYIWRRSSGDVLFLERPFGFLDSAEHRESPLAKVIAERRTLFFDEQALRGDVGFEVVREFRRAGATSYAALPVPAVRGDVHVFALWTDRADGWTRTDIAEVTRVVPLLSHLIEVTESRRLLGVIGAAQEVTQRALAEQALRSSEALLRQRTADMERLEIERQARLETERKLEEKTRDLARRNDQLRALADSLEEKVFQRTQKLEEAVQHAQAATQAKSRFLATMSHEIRTPMHGILGVAELIAGPNLTAEQGRYISVLQRTGTSLLALIDDILDFSKIEADRLELESIAFEPCRLLEDVAALLRAPSETRGLHLDVACSPQVPRVVMGDPTRLRQILFNLIGNAVKFTERGSVTVQMDAVDLGPHRVTLRGTVRDTGPGISEETQRRLFEPFAQGDSSTSRRFGGSGLGLAICHRLLAQMGGGLSVHSKPGAGSVFTFSAPVDLPLATMPAKPAPGPTASTKDPAPRPMGELHELRILLVDDNAVNRLIAEAQLRSMGNARTTVAQNGAEALDLLSRQPFDVVLMDLQMPEMDGIEATQRLRGLPLPAQPCVLAMTASAFEEDRRAALAAGMDGFLSKPVSISALRAALTELEDRPPRDLGPRPS
jgi:signal transduction histidine kinase/ActR/RegA family two-component response regulator